MTRLMGRLTLSQRLFVIGLIAVLPSCAALVLNEVELRRQRLNEIHADAAHNGALALSEMKQIIAGARAVLEATSLTPLVRSQDTNACDDYLQNVIKHVDSIADIVVTDREGHTRCGTVHVDIADRDYLQTALSQDRFTIGGYITGRTSGRPRLPLTMPLHDDAGQIVGAVITSLDVDWLGQQVKGRALAPGNALTIADRNGVILAREPYSGRFVGTRIPDLFQPLVHGSSAGTQEITSQDGTRRVIGYIPAPVSGIDLYISVGIEAVDAYAAIEKASLRAFSLVAFGGIAALLLAWWFGRAQIRTPVQRILQTTERFTSGNFKARTRLQGSDGEIEAIGEAFDRFADQLERREAERDEAARQRELLIQELNHRVKNVLTVVQSVATSTLRRDVAPDRLADFEKRIEAIARSHELLTLSNWDRADIREIIKAVVIPVCGTDEARIRYSGPSFVMEPIPALSMSMLLHELCTNAVKYGALSVPGGSVVLTWEVRPDGTRRFSWREIDGPPVSAPTRRGFGSRLIETLGRRLGGTTVLTYAVDGLVCDVELGPANAEPGEPEPARSMQQQA